MNDALAEITASLHSYWQQFLEAIPRIVMAVVVLVIGFLLINWLINPLRKRILRRANDPLMGGFLSNSIRLILVVCVLMLSLHAAGLSGVAGALLATAGASAVVLGFAFKDIAENFLAGIILAFNRPFNVNDTVQIETIFGRVKTMQFRYTHIKTFDGKDVYVPNSDVLTKPVINYTEDGFIRLDFIVGIAYENDIAQAKKIILDRLKSYPDVMQDEDHVNFVVEDELAASTVNLKVYFWVETTDFRRAALETRGIVIQRIKEALEENGFNLPAEIRELKFYNASAEFPIRITDRQQPLKNTK